MKKYQMIKEKRNSEYKGHKEKEIGIFEEKKKENKGRKLREE